MSWDIDGPFRRDGGTADGPSRQKIEAKLSQLKRKNGTLRLTATRGGRAKTLRLRADSRRYLVQMDFETDDDHVVRDYPGSSDVGGMTHILGEPFSAASICLDFEAVRAIFSEFIATGDVGDALDDPV